MATQPPTGTPFGLEQNVAAGLAYLLGPIGAIIMLVGGGTNAFVKWAAAQSLMLAVVYIVLRIVVGFAFGIFHFFALILLPFVMLLGLLVFAAWLWTSISAFQGKEVRLPVVADLTTRF
ncbi:MAG TPA: hypothetical protein VMV73_03960, partial [Candidatus Dormibacteraeota bacterium]|nr:hypothetical protein [Candidatus Dormibacteraeota bacterium]